jgi:hypothetical protein
MSRNSTAYFAIVGTLAFALPGAASAGQVNIPHINLNIPRPQINIRPQISVPTTHPSVATPHFSISRAITFNQTSGSTSRKFNSQRPFLGNFSTHQPLGTSEAQVPSASPFATMTRAGSTQGDVMTQPGGGQGQQPYGAITTLRGSGSGTQSGSTQGGAYTSTNGDAYTSTNSGGYSTVGKANASPSLRCRSKGGVSNCPG